MFLSLSSLYPVYIQFISSLYPVYIKFISSLLTNWISTFWCFSVFRCFCYKLYIWAWKICRFLIIWLLELEISLGFGCRIDVCIVAHSISSHQFSLSHSLSTHTMAKKRGARRVATPQAGLATFGFTAKPVQAGDDLENLVHRALFPEIDPFTDTQVEKCMLSLVCLKVRSIYGRLIVCIDTPPPPTPHSPKKTTPDARWADPIAGHHPWTSI